MIKAKINRSKLMKALRKSSDSIRSEFKWIIERNSKELTTSIKDLIIRGISPVFGITKFQRYSESYKEQIEGKARYYTTKNMNVVRVEPEKKRFPRGLGYGKKLRPINMTLTGEMLESLKAGNRRDEPMIWFDDKKANYHNDGADLWHGGKLPVRRLLPNKPGERFHRNVFKLIRSYAGKAIEKAFKSIIK